MGFFPAENTTPEQFVGNLRCICEHCGESVISPVSGGSVQVLIYDSDERIADPADMFQHIIDCRTFDTVSQFLKWTDALPEYESHAEHLPFVILYYRSDGEIFRYADNLLFRNYAAFCDIFDLRPDTMVIELDPDMFVAYALQKDIMMSDEINRKHAEAGEIQRCNPMTVGLAGIPADQIGLYAPVKYLNDQLWDITAGPIVRNYDSDLFRCTCSFQDCTVTIEPRKTDDPAIREQQRLTYETVYLNLYDDLTQYMAAPDRLYYKHNPDLPDIE